MTPKAHICSLYRPMPEATTLRDVQACTGRLGAASLSPKGAHATLEAARREA